MASPPHAPASDPRRWLRRLNLSHRLALGVSLGFVALFAAFSLIGELALQESARRIRAERMAIAQLTAAELDQLLGYAVAELERIGSYAAFDPSSLDQGAEAQILASAAGPGSLFDGVLLLDAAGRVAIAAPADLVTPDADLAAAGALAGTGATLSAPFLNAASGQPQLAVRVPLGAPGGQLVGLVSLGGDTVALMLETASTLGASGHAVIFDREGRSLISTYPVPPFSPGEHAAFFRAAIARGAPVVASVPYELDLPGEPRGHPHIMAAAFLTRAPLGVAVGGDESETYAGVRWLRLGLIALGMGSLTAIWALTLFGARSLVRPVQRLTTAAERIAAGDLETPLAAPEGGEIGAMARALEHMRVQLLGLIADLAASNSTLESRVATRTEELRRQSELTQLLLGRLITAQEDERARLARELHDEVGQMLTAVQLGLDRLSKALPADPAGPREQLGDVRALIAQTLADLRRLIADLRPGVLDQLGLVPALHWVAEHTIAPLGMQVVVDDSALRERLPTPIETVLFRIGQEAIHNIARHSGAGTVRIGLAHEGDEAVMTISDDGRGFNPNEVAPADDRRRGLGLAGMAERATLAGGHVIITSAPGQGTTLRVVVPLAVKAVEEKP